MKAGNAIAAEPKPLMYILLPKLHPNREELSEWHSASNHDSYLFVGSNGG